MLEDAELLRRYAEESSEAAFAELVKRYVDLVYSAALRQVGGDTHRARDVSQVVFTTLARKAGSLASHPVLAGWLYTATQHAAAKTIRSELRRQTREQEALRMENILSPNSPSDRTADWDRVRPVLDAAMSDLNDRDREAVLLRFFAHRPFAEIGRTLHLGEDAARMRVDRALDKLRGLLARRGVTSTSAALSSALATQASRTAPADLAAQVTGAALLGSATLAGGILDFMATNKIGIGIATLAIAAGSTLATNQSRAAREARKEIALLAEERTALIGKIQGMEESLATAEQRLRRADADADQSLNSIKETSPAIGFPPGDAECIAFVIDTSGSMRNAATGNLWKAVLRAIERALAAHPNAKYIQGFDADGRLIFGASEGWVPRSDDTLTSLERLLQTNQVFTESNPVPGIYRAMRVLPAAGPSGARLHVCVIGDESMHSPEISLKQLEQINPVGANGQRRATISAIQLPTTVRLADGQMAATGQKFQQYMTEVARRHGGAYVLLPTSMLEAEVADGAEK